MTTSPSDKDESRSSSSAHISNVNSQELNMADSIGFDDNADVKISNHDLSSENESNEYQGRISDSITGELVTEKDEDWNISKSKGSSDISTVISSSTSNIHSNTIDYKSSDDSQLLENDAPSSESGHIENDNVLPESQLPVAIMVVKSSASSDCDISSEEIATKNFLEIDQESIIEDKNMCYFEHF